MGRLPGWELAGWTGLTDALAGRFRFPSASFPSVDPSRRTGSHDIEGRVAAPTYRLINRLIKQELMDGAGANGRRGDAVASQGA
ncbi:MAG TPA: hypothetical protein VK844_03015, partial [Hyphomicrobiales bacterium]|nr:hypothetical protein [Hyphomicrobiales bacterium]